MAALVAALVGAEFWHYEHAALQATRMRIVASTLESLATLLKEDQALLDELQADPFTEKGAGILQSYLAKIRRDEASALNRLPGNHGCERSVAFTQRHPSIAHFVNTRTATHY